MWLELAKYLGLVSIPLFASIALCYLFAGQIGNAVINIGITILYFGLFYLVIYKGVM